MVKYAVLEFKAVRHHPMLLHLGEFQLESFTVYSELDDIKEAEFHRLAYLNHWPDVNPQNVQVIQYTHV